MDTNLTGRYVLAADIGGSHITTAVCDISTNEIFESTYSRIEFNSKGSAESILRAWTDSLAESHKKHHSPVNALGIGMPGPFDYNDGISYIKGLDKYEALYGMNIKAYLAERLNVDAGSIRFRNDTEALIAGEVANYYGAEFKNIIGISLGTGFGSSHYLNGSTTDLNWGSLPYRLTIADDYFSTRWFLKRYYEYTGKSANNVKHLAAIGGEPVTDIFKEFVDNLSGFLSLQSAPLQPEAILICGNIAKAYHLFIHELRTNLSPLTIELARINENAALLGAASLFQAGL